MTYPNPPSSIKIWCALQLRRPGGRPGLSLPLFVLLLSGKDYHWRYLENFQNIYEYYTLFSELQHGTEKIMQSLPLILPFIFLLYLCTRFCIKCLHMYTHKSFICVQFKQIAAGVSNLSALQQYQHAAATPHP